MKACDCNASLGNTGTPQCKTIESVAVGLIYVPRTDKLGVRNGIDLSVTLNQAYWDGKFNEVDPFKRFYPSPRLEAVEDVRADSIFETLPSGRNIKVQDGTRTFQGAHIRQSTTFLDKISRNGCAEFDAYVVDKNGSLIGTVSDDGTMLYGIKIDADTWDPQLIKTTDTTVQKIMIKFEWDQTETDADLRQINSDETGVDLTNIKGLLDVLIGSAGVTAITTTTFTIPLELCYGTAKNKIKVSGLVLADFSLYNETQAAAVVPTTVTENPADSGVYDFVIPAQTSLDQLTLTIDKDGLDGSAVSAVTIDIP